MAQQPDRPLVDVPESWPVLQHTVLAHGKVSDFIEDVIQNTTGGTMARQWTSHTGSVAIIALDEADRVAVVHQYRHPASLRMLEPPAGLLDIAKEDALSGAVRELAEEARLEADNWRILADELTSPGGSQEHLRVFLATGLHPASRPEGFVATDEEADMGLHWVGFDELLAGVLAGTMQSPTLVVGILALAYARATNSLDRLRPADWPWPARELKLQRDRARD